MTWLESLNTSFGSFRHFGYLKRRDTVPFFAPDFWGFNHSVHFLSAQNLTGRGTEITVGPAREGGGLLLAIAIPGPNDPIPEGKSWRSLDHGFPVSLRGSVAP
jgi:hypothetical protein